MEYAISLLKHQGDGLLGIIISSNTEEHSAAIANYPAWEVIQTTKFALVAAYPSAICNVLLITEETSDRLFRNIADTWLGSKEYDSLNDFTEYSAREEAKGLLHGAYLDRLDGSDIELK